MIAAADPVEAVLSRLDNVHRSGAGWAARCPAHEDRHNSLSIGTGAEGQALIHCFAGCALDAILGAVGMRTSDLYPPTAASANGRPPDKPVRRLVKTTRYPIRNGAGATVAVHIRRDFDDGSKSMPWERPDGQSGLGGMPYSALPLYGVHEIGDAEAVVVCEGEKARDALAAYGAVAVGTVTGADGCPSDDSLQPLVGLDRIIMWPDSDEAGRMHMEKITRRLLALGQPADTIRWVEWPDAPSKGDAADCTAEEARRLIAEAPVWTPRAREPNPGALHGPGLVITSLADVRAAPVDWLWRRWLARKKLHILGGHAGDGKSTLTAALAAILSTAGTLPDGTPAPRLRTLFLLAEDALDDTLRPRLDAHGADVTQIMAIEAVREPDGSDRAFSIARHLPELETEIKRRGIDALIIDPVTSFMPGADRNGEGDVRDVLTPLGKLAERTGVAVIAIMHVGKPNGTQRRPLQQLLGATAFGAIARVVWMVAPVPDDETGARRVLGVVKSNLAMKPDPIEWSRSEDGPIVWHGASTHRLDDLLGGQASAPRDNAAGFLAETLKGGSLPANDVLALAKAAGIADVTLSRAADAMHVHRFKEQGIRNGRWFWKLPNGEPTRDTDESGDSGDSGEDDHPAPESKMITPKDDQVIIFDSSHIFGKMITRTDGDHLPRNAEDDQDDHLTPLSGDHLRLPPAACVGGSVCVRLGPCERYAAGLLCESVGGAQWASN